MINLSDQTALITGGSRGIGAATALILAKAGCSIAVVYQKNIDYAKKTAANIKKLQKDCLIIRGNVEKYTDCKRIVEATKNKYGKIDILINCAGIWEYGEMGKMTINEWKRTIDINLNGTFNMCSLVVPLMKRRKYGRIINISSTAGQRGEPFHSHYAASKGAIIAFTKSLGPELIKYGIWVNCVAPGWVDTDMVSHLFKNSKSKNEIIRTIPRGKIAKPEEIAGPILFLASNLADNVVGEILNVNGGSLLCG